MWWQHLFRDVVSEDNIAKILYCQSEQLTMVVWKNESRKLYATKVRKKNVIGHIMKKKSTGEHCDDWKDHW